MNFTEYELFQNTCRKCVWETNLQALKIKQNKKVIRTFPIFQIKYGV